MKLIFLVLTLTIATFSCSSKEIRVYKEDECRKTVLNEFVCEQ